MRRILLTACTIAIMTSAPHAKAGGFFDLGEWMNVVSFGEVGRERDNERATRDRILALERELAAERMKQQKIESLFRETAIIGASLASDEQILSALEIMQKLIESQKRFMLVALHLMMSSDISYKGISQLVLLQQSDLELFVDYGLEKDPTNSYLLGLKNKIGLLSMQIRDFPKPEMPVEDFDAFLDQAFQNSNEAVALVEQTIEMLKNKIQAQKDEIKSRDEEIKRLKEKPKPKPVYIPVCRKMPNKPGCFHEN